MSTRRNFSAEFKAKVALVALVGDKTLAELAAKHDVHPNMITQWKRQAKEGLPEAFGKKASRGSTDRDADVKELYAKIGQHTVRSNGLTRSALITCCASIKRRRIASTWASLSLAANSRMSRY